MSRTPENRKANRRVTNRKTRTRRKPTKPSGRELGKLNETGLLALGATLGIACSLGAALDSDIKFLPPGWEMRTYIDNGESKIGYVNLRNPFIYELKEGEKSGDEIEIEFDGRNWTAVIPYGENGEELNDLDNFEINIPQRTPPIKQNSKEPAYHCEQSDRQSFQAKTYNSILHSVRGTPQSMLMNCDRETKALEFTDRGSYLISGTAVVSAVAIGLAVASGATITATTGAITEAASQDLILGAAKTSVPLAAGAMTRTLQLFGSSALKEVSPGKQLIEIKGKSWWRPVEARLKVSQDTSNSILKTRAEGDVIKPLRSDLPEKTYRGFKPRYDDFSKEAVEERENVEKGIKEATFRWQRLPDNKPSEPKITIANELKKVSEFDEADGILSMKDITDSKFSDRLKKFPPERPTGMSYSEYKRGFLKEQDDEWFF